MLKNEIFLDKLADVLDGLEVSESEEDYGSESEAESDASESKASENTSQKPAKIGITNPVALHPSMGSIAEEAAPSRESNQSEPK